jgi:hypothetical protein
VTGEQKGRSRGVAKALDLHAEFIKAWGDKQTSPYSRNPGKAQLWNTLNELMKQYRGDDERSVSDVGDKLNTNSGSYGDTQFEMFMGESKSDATPGDYIDAAPSTPENNFSDFGKMVIAHRAEVEIWARRLVGYMMWGEAVVGEDGVVDVSGKDLSDPGGIDKRNAFVTDLSSKPYAQQVSTLAQITTGLGETDVGKRFLALQFARRDWENDRDVSEVVFDPYKLFYPREVPQAKLDLSVDVEGQNPDLLGIAIAKTNAEGLPSRDDLFTGAGHVRHNGATQYTQSKDLLRHLPTLLGNLSPGVLYLHRRTKSGDSEFDVDQSVAKQNVDRFGALAWGKFQSHDIKKHFGTSESYSYVGDVAKGNPPKTTSKSVLDVFADNAAKIADVNDKLMVESSAYSNRLNFNEQIGGSGSRLRWFGVIKVVVVGYGMYNRIEETAQGGVDTVAVAELGAATLKAIGDLKTFEDIAGNFDAVGNVASRFENASTIASKWVTALGRIAPIVDIYFTCKSAYGTYEEYEEGDYWAAGGKAVAVGGGVLVLIGTLASVSNPMGWIVAGGVLGIGGGILGWGFDDTKMQNRVEQTYFGTGWSGASDVAKYQEPGKHFYRYVTPDGRTNFARQMSELKRVSTPLNPTAKLTSNRLETVDVLELKIEPNASKPSSMKRASDVRTGGVLYVRPILPKGRNEAEWGSEGGENQPHIFAPVYYKLVLGEEHEYDPDTGTISSSGSGSEVPVHSLTDHYETATNKSLQTGIDGFDFEMKYSVHTLQSANRAGTTEVIGDVHVAIRANYVERPEKIYLLGHGGGDLDTGGVTRIPDYYLELTYVPEEVHRKVEGSGILETPGAFNRYDWLERLPSVVRARVEVADPMRGAHRDVKDWHEIVEHR